MRLAEGAADVGRPWSAALAAPCGRGRTADLHNPSPSFCFSSSSFSRSCKPQPPRFTLLALFLLLLASLLPDFNVALALEHRHPNGHLRGRPSLVSSKVSSNTSANLALITGFSEELAHLKAELDEHTLQCQSRKARQDTHLESLRMALQRATSNAATMETKLSNAAGQLAPAEGQLMNAREQLKLLNQQCLEQEKVLKQAKQNKTLDARHTDELLRKVVSSCQASGLAATSFLACSSGCSARSPLSNGGSGSNSNSNMSSKMTSCAALFRSTVAEIRRHPLKRRRLIEKELGLDIAASPHDKVCKRLFFLQQKRQHNKRRSSATVPVGSVEPSPPKLLPATARSAEPVPGGTMKGTGLPGNCGPSLKDLVDSMLIKAWDIVNEADAELVEHQRGCSAEAEPMKIEAKQRLTQIRQAEIVIANAQPAKVQWKLQLAKISEQVRFAEARREELEKSCAFAIDEYNNEIYRLEETRNIMAQRLLGKEENIVFLDCEVTEWKVASACSQECIASDGTVGQQLWTREAITQPGDSEIGRLSAPCPSLKKTRKCNEKPCAVDCEMSEWTEWAACSRQCGGGDQFRTREPQQFGRNGGQVCGATTEVQSCNVESCTTDCELGDWTEWSSCNRRCMWVSNSSATDSPSPGHASRMRPILANAVGGGTCLPEAQRTQWRECNAVYCTPPSVDDGTGLDSESSSSASDSAAAAGSAEPAGIVATSGVDPNIELNCTADQDIVFVLDGSGSVARGDTTVNFDLQVDLVTDFIEKSEFSREGSTSDVRSVRYGLLSIGTPENVTVLSPLTNKRTDLESKLGEAKPGRGSSTISQALLVAQQLLLKNEGSRTMKKRSKSVVLFSDGGTRSPRVAVSVASRLKEEGIRILTLLIQAADGPVASLAERTFCGLSSEPCVDNVLRVGAWADLPSQLDRFMAVVCPTP